jgi:hypothetical protein
MSVAGIWDVTMDVGDWLRSLGLSEYESAFRDNQIDSEVLPKLTGDDLKELGLASVGHRRKLLSAIAELTGAFAEPAAVAKAIRLDPPVHAAAERRQLTVMFCDLVGSTAISARLDPEDMREMIAAYHQCCASLIERGGGSSPNTWATACSAISAIRKRTSMTLSGQ